MKLYHYPPIKVGDRVGHKISNDSSSYREGVVESIWSKDDSLATIRITPFYARNCHIKTLIRLKKKRTKDDLDSDN